MVYPLNAIDKLGFYEIKDKIKQKCLSESGRELVEKIQPQTRFDQIDRFLRQTSEFKDLLVNDGAFPVENFFPLKSIVEKARVEGAFLLEEEFFRVLLSLKTVYAIIRYFNEREGLYPNLEVLFEHLPIEKGIIRDIETVIDERGKLKNNASRLLLEITQQIQRAEQDALKRINSIFKNAQDSGWTADGNLTVRDGRLCIPILAENKRKLKGLIHDESATGQTAYIEPEEVFQLNNKIRDLEFERRREVIRILVELKDKVRPHLPLLLSYHGLLTKVDFVRAKALFALDIEAEMPELSKEAEINLINARHPLLILNEHHKGTVVPLNIQIDQLQRVIVVSGPNAGGKSVCMKTVGLLQIMVQSGLLIPAEPTTKVGVFKQIFADIGDDQSIESDLSTYSAHLSKMKYFTEFANGRTLVLIDEFGTGTDPLFGGPIAEAVLESLNKKQIRGVVTTHYSNLKVFASNTTGLENASMLFDNREMRPMYILQIGKPGSSYAFEIAQKIGLGKDILEAAKGKIGVQQKKVDTLLIDLEREKKEVFDTKVAINKREKELESLKSEYLELQSYLEENKRVILKKAKEEAQEIIKNSNKLIENTVAQIKSAKADKEKTRELRSNLDQALKAVLPKEQAAKQVIKEKITESSELTVGDWVQIIDNGAEAQVVEIAKNNLILAMGELRTVQKRKNVLKLEGRENKKSAKSLSKSLSAGTVADFNPEIDLRGMRTEDALNELEKVLDRAVMVGYPSLKIIHGKGDGILRKFIRDYLRKYSHVSRFEDEHQDRGGDGITYAYL
ncbi:endonuclease MutS2 [Sphingobacterium sp. DR205]|uniref:endonuclease MutS2 n=1 Tax=Sphingobacterium sp. DR205 TaxID=2713573 RepID=UPI0013E416BB|nr:endonuclease MutS2 [Sphingobacterium sp. DR205]QIH33909.1 endonuclease MutS2 [Sphingobacterium sp. DR205]